MGKLLFFLLFFNFFDSFLVLSIDTFPIARKASKYTFKNSILDDFSIDDFLKKLFSEYSHAAFDAEPQESYPYQVELVRLLLSVPIQNSKFRWNTP